MGISHGKVRCEAPWSSPFGGHRVSYFKACGPRGSSRADDPWRPQEASRSSFISHMSTDTRMPGVSEASMALNACAPAAMSSAVSKY